MSSWIRPSSGATVTAGQGQVTISGTWLANLVRQGYELIAPAPSGPSYEITAVGTSGGNTVLTLDRPYSGASATAAVVAIKPLYSTDAEAASAFATLLTAWMAPLGQIYRTSGDSRELVLRRLIGTSLAGVTFGTDTSDTFRIGLFGDNIFRLQRSTNGGTSWADTITVDPTTGDVNFAGLAALLAAKAPIDSPTLTGTPKVPLAAVGDSSTQAANTAWVQAEIASHNADQSAALSALSTTVGNKQDKTAATTALAALTPAARKLPYFSGANTAALADLSDFCRTMLAAADATSVRTAIGAQQISALLTALAAVTMSADRLVYADSATTFATTVLSAFARTLLDDGDAGTARATLGAQAASAVLSLLSGLSPAADRLPYFTASNAAALATITSFARSLLDDTDAATARSTLGAQAASAVLSAIAGLTQAADTLPYFTGSTTAGATTLTAFARSLLDDADASTARATLGAQVATTALGLIGGLAPVADKLPYFSASNAASLTSITAFARSLLDDGDAATALTTLGAQAASAVLSLLASVSPAADKLPYFTASNAAGTTTLSAFGRSLLDDADAATARGTLGAQAALGYTPLNKAGDSTSGTIDVATQVNVRKNGTDGNAYFRLGSESGNEWGLIWSNGGSLNLRALGGTAVNISSDGNIYAYGRWLNSVYSSLDNTVSTANAAWNKADDAQINRTQKINRWSAEAVKTGAGSLAMVTGNHADFNWSNGFYYRIDGNPWVLINSSPSDAKLKNIGGGLSAALETVRRLNPVTYEFRPDLPIEVPTGERAGFVAQDLRSVMPTLVKEVGNPGEEGETYLALEQDAPVQLIAVLTKATQELATRVEALEAERPTA